MQILKDIESAKKYAKGDIDQYYMNEAAIYALEARVNLYMHRFEAAAKAANEAIKLRDSDGVSNDTYVTMWRSVAITGEDIFTLVKSNDDNLSANSLNTLYGSYKGSVSQFTKDMINSTDIRSKLIYNSSAFEGHHPGKFDGLPSSLAVGNIPVFRLSEMYLIVAESEAQLGNVGASQKALLYTAKRDSKITSESDLPATKDALLTFIADERVRELFVEGHRFYDLRRTGAVAEIGGDPNFVAQKFVFPIPSEEINSGFGVKQNEGWNDNLPTPPKKD